MTTVSVSGNCKGYCVDRHDLMAAERKAMTEGLTFEFVAINNGRGWIVYPTKADEEIIDTLHEASLNHHYEIMEGIAGLPESVVLEEKKSFPQRHPNLPLVLAICALIGSIIAPLLR